MNRYFDQFEVFDFASIESKVSREVQNSIFIFACGYEQRSIAQFTKVIDKLPKDKVCYVCCGFSSFKISGSRRDNEKEITNHGVEIYDFEPTDWQSVWALIERQFSRYKPSKTAVFIDYSSMPRNWYCELACKMIKGQMGEDVTFLYSQGRYFEDEYPCVGYGEFHRFSGRPDITQTREICLFGLGFDSTRTYGIWTYLDPQSSVVIIGKTPRNASHCDRVRKENYEIIAQSDTVAEVRIDLFPDALAQLIDLTRRYNRFGDVALVADGPKPLTLAMSLVPYYLDWPGVYSWHVGHVKPRNYEPIDIEASGRVYGFTMREPKKNGYV